MASPEPRWLTDAEQQTWRAFLAADRLFWEALERQLQAESGLSHADYEILAQLSEAPGHEIRMSELAGRTYFSRSRLSHAVARLESLGWVGRRSCPTDRRGTLAVLTERGLAAIEAAAPGHVAAVRRFLFDAIEPTDVAHLVRIADRMRAALRPAELGADECAEDAALTDS